MRLHGGVVPPLDVVIAARVSHSHEPWGIVAANRVEDMLGEFDQDADRWVDRGQL